MSDDAIPVVIREIIAGDGLTYAQGAKLLPGHRGEGTADASCLWRWATAGAKSPDGRLVKLEVARLGGRWLTSRGALARFAAALTTAPRDATPAPARKRRSATERKRAADAATKRLAAAGA